MKFMMITVCPEIASYVETRGVSRIFIDQEVHGKAERQRHLNAHKANHTMKDVSNIASIVSHAEVMVRLNPLHSKSHEEISAALDHGAQRLMLPMFNCRTEVMSFTELVGERVPITFLCETSKALNSLPEWVQDIKSCGNQVHFGLNDLSLSFGYDFLFEPLAHRILDEAAERLNNSKICWGIGGLGKVGQGLLPAEKIVGEHVRLGSNWAILSRAFHDSSAGLEEFCRRTDMKKEMTALKTAELFWKREPMQALENNQHEIRVLIDKIIEDA